jgi:hypothetical protein
VEYSEFHVHEGAAQSPRSYSRMMHCDRRRPDEAAAAAAAKEDNTWQMQMKERQC